MPNESLFAEFFQGRAWNYLLRSVDLALEEDGQDLTSQALFTSQDQMQAVLVAKENTLLAGLPLMEIILSRINPEPTAYAVQYLLQEGSRAEAGQEVCLVQGQSRDILKGERVILNFISHLSGIANLTSTFVQQLQGSKTRLLDTRKTLPGLRYPEKYAVRLAGGTNHRLHLAQMLMLKDNHLDRAGGITRAVQKLRHRYGQDCPPIEVECRNLSEVEEACACSVHRIMLDNMHTEAIIQALALIPAGIESEISGNINLERLSDLSGLGADYVSVGCLTNSAAAVDLSLRTNLKAGDAS